MRRKSTNSEKFTLFFRSNMRRLFFLLLSLSIAFASPGSTVNILTDEDCWSAERNQSAEKSFSTLVNFSPKVAYGRDSCRVQLENPWVEHMQNGFGVFLARQMDCSAVVTVECLDQNVPSFQLTCHTSERNKQMACNRISLAFQRSLKTQEKKRSTAVQVVALAKGPCIDDDVLYRCSSAYNDSCIDEKLVCNGRSECPNGDDERACHNPRPTGVPILVIVLLVLAFLFLICVLSTVLVCYCCRAACIRIVRRFRPSKKPSKGDVTVTGEDAGLMKSLTTPATVINVVPQQAQPSEAKTLIIDSTKPIYPRLE